MLSERQLSRGYRLFWSQWAPELSQQWLSKMHENRTLAHRVDRWAAPLSSALPPRDADLIAETAFGLFAAAFRLGKPVQSLSANECKLIVKSATHRIMQLRGSGRDLSGVISPEHLGESETLAIRLLDWASTRRHPANIQPRLSGVGIVDACHPDMIAGPELIEVKMGSSPFRLDDIRQVLVYAALIWRGSNHQIQNLILTNPRMGIDWHFGLREMVVEISGKSLSEFFEDFERLNQ